MVEKYGRIPPVSIREQYYDPRSGQGYIAYRLKTVQRNSVNNLKGVSKVVSQDGPKTLRETSTTEQLSGDECTEAISIMKHSTDAPVIKVKMKATFKYRQELMHDPDKSPLILDYFPRFLDTPGLIDQDFTMHFGDDISSKFIAKWPTFYKPRIIADCKNLHHGAHVDNLLSALEESDYGKYKCWGFTAPTSLYPKKGWWATANPGSVCLEPVPSQAAVQDAHAEAHSRMRPSPGLVCSDQPEGHVLLCLDFASPQTLPTIAPYEAASTLALRPGPEMGVAARYTPCPRDTELQSHPHPVVGPLIPADGSAPQTAPPWPIPLRKDPLTQIQGTLWHPHPDLWNLHVWSLDRMWRF
ncbi:uncharacterized protein LOC125266037 [Megalobrama amblycephala]|uniref:uncharacterized protein LOC125266037 n=1 Tax=Megalobrama amblycephala TaxID=75352 RepID=UPI0020140EF7|nr:uncharacterized protein LOC125266037 [Megalobrama amblycephala]